MDQSSSEQLKTHPALQAALDHYGITHAYFVSRLHHVSKTDFHMRYRIYKHILNQHDGRISSLEIERIAGVTRNSAFHVLHNVNIEGNQ